MSEKNIGYSDSSKTPTENSADNSPEYELNEEETESLCRTFSLLDDNGDGVINPSEIANLLVSLGRLPFDEDFAHVMTYARSHGCEEDAGIDFPEFRKLFSKQLVNTKDAQELRKAFEVLDTDPPTGKVDVRDLRQYLKRKGLKLTDDEIDFLYKEQNYWMLEEKYMFRYEELINKILDSPLPRDPFLRN